MSALRLSVLRRHLAEGPDTEETQLQRADCSAQEALLPPKVPPPARRLPPLPPPPACPMAFPTPRFFFQDQLYDWLTRDNKELRAAIFEFLKDPLFRPNYYLSMDGFRQLTSQRVAKFVQQVCKGGAPQPELAC